MHGEDGGFFTGARASSKDFYYSASHIPLTLPNRDNARST